MALIPPSWRSPDPLSRDCSSLEETAGLLFDSRCSCREGWLLPEVIQELFATLRLGEVSLPQVRAAMKKVCSNPGECTREEFPVLLRDVERRYQILQGALWEFALLDKKRTQSITEEDAQFLFRAVHRDYFTLGVWQTFLTDRQYPGTRVTWDEIEVPLCDLPEWTEVDALREVEMEKGGWSLHEWVWLKGLAALFYTSL